MKKNKFEYKVVVVNDASQKEDSLLNEMGKKGFELVAVKYLAAETVLYFKKNA